jgi:hypothetical protein
MPYRAHRPSRAEVRTAAVFRVGRSQRKNALWVIGGESLSTGAVLNDVWTSSDGKTWTQATASAFPARAFFAATASDSALCIAGGQFSASQLAKDVWCSADGTTWIATTTAAPWGGREFAELVSFNGRLWIIGGFWGFWSSTDGRKWTLVTSSAQFSPRSDQVPSI